MKRLDQWLSNLGYCSRREAREWLAAGQVTRAANGAPYDDPGERCPAEAIQVDGQPLDHPHGLLLAMNKPLGAVCSHDTREGPRVYDLLPDRWMRRSPAVTTVGRLDRDTSGLVLLTDQSPLVHRLTSPKHKVPKRYRARLAQAADSARQEEAVRRFAAGELIVDGQPCLPAELSFQGESSATVVLLEGRYHQVRRMFGEVGLTVMELHRFAFGSLFLPEDLALGQFIFLPIDYSF